jgi:hypothetical protein
MDDKPTTQAHVRSLLFCSGIICTSLASVAVSHATKADRGLMNTYRQMVADHEELVEVHRQILHQNRTELVAIEEALAR